MTPSDIFDRYAADYDTWFQRHPHVWASELAAVRELLPKSGEGLEVGVGSGRFAGPLGIRCGVEPSSAMRQMAANAGIDAVEGTAEALPFPDESFDSVLMVTTLCFLEDPTRAAGEAYRVLRPAGVFIVGFIDRTSPLGQKYERNREASRFYRGARFHSVIEVAELLTDAGFERLDFRQTLFSDPDRLEHPDPVRTGHGKGAFVVVRGNRPAG